MAHNNATVRFTIPASLAFEPKGLAGALESIAERLGCRACFSGADCLFQLERDFVIDLKRNAVAKDAAHMRAGPVVDFAVPTKVLDNIDSLKKVAEVAFGKLGCLPCTSGFDILFRDTIRTVVIDEKMNVQRFGRGF